MSNLPKVNIRKPPIPSGVTQQGLARTKMADFNDMYNYAGSEGFVSRYPTYNPYTNNEYAYAKNQSWTNKLANGAKSFGSIVSSTFLNQVGKTLNNLLGNVGWNTSSGKSTAGKIMAAMHRNPIYKSQEAAEYEENNKGFLGAVGKYVPFVSPDFFGYWAQAGSQLGFTAGTVGYMFAENLLLKRLGLSSGVSLPKQLKNLYKTLYYVKNFEKARKAAYITGKATQLTKSAGQFGLYTARMANLASGEGSIEANIAANEFYYDQYLKLKEQGLATPDKLSEVQRAAQKVGNSTFGMNIGILTASNFITMGNIFKPSFLFKDMYKEAAKGLVKQQGKYYTKKELANTFLKKVGFYGKKAIKGTAKNINEGFEEVAQGIASRASQNYYDILKSDIGKSNISLIDEIGKEAVESFKSGEGWDEFISGMITGMGIGGFKYGVNKIRGKNKEAYQQQERARDLRNESMQEYIAAFTESRNYRNLNEQTALSVENAKQVAEGNQKAIKDLRTEARNSLFETMYKTGAGDEHIDFMFEGLEAIQKENPLALEETVGERNLESEKAELKSQYKEWAKRADKNMTAFNSDNYSNKEAYQRAIFDLTSMENHLQDTIARVENIKSTLRENTANSPMAGKLNDVMEALADPQKFDDLIANQQQFVDAQQDSLNNLELSEEERTARQKELEQEKEYLSILKDSKERIVDNEGNVKENFNSDSTISRLIQNFNKIDQANFNSRVQPELRDLMTLSVERSNLLKTINILSDERYFKKYAEAYQMVQEAHRKSILNRFKNQDKPTEQNKVDEAASNTQVNSQETEEVKNLAEQIDIEEGRYTYRGKPYDSFDKAFEAMLKDASEAVRKQPEVIKALKEETKKRLTSASPTQSEQGTTGENESVVPQKVEEQWKKDQDISKVPDEVLENIFQKPVNTRTELERQLLDADEARGESSYASRSSAARSKQSEDVDNVPKTKSDVKNERPFTESSTSTLVHFFKHAVAVINTINGYLSKNNSVNLDKEVINLLSFLYDKNKKSKYSVTTIHLNDTIITDNIREAKDATQDQIRQDLKENDVAIIKDSRGRLILITEGSSLQGTKQKIADLYGLYINADDRGKISSIRIRSYDGELVESSFEQNVFTADSLKQVNKLGKGDRVQVVIPNNEYNRKLVANFQAAVAKLVEKPNYSIDKAKELYEKMVLNDLVIDFISQGSVVGRMRSGNYFTVDSNKVTGKIVNFRTDMVSYEEFMEFVKQGGDRNRVVGTVEVDTTYTERNVGLDEQGNFIFNTLEEYEKSLEDNPDLDVKIEYFVATSRHVMEDKNGNKVGTSEINRNKPFRTGAVYMRATDSEGNFLVMQAVRDDSKTYTKEDLKKNDFKKELEVNLKTGENPVINKRLYINRSSFDSQAPEQSYIEKITTELKKADGNSAYITHNGKKVKYSNVAVDEEVQLVYATQENGLVIEIPFRDVREVNGVAPSTTTTQTTNKQQEADIERKKNNIKTKIINKLQTFFGEVLSSSERATEIQNALISIKSNIPNIIKSDKQVISLVNELTNLIQNQFKDKSFLNRQEQLALEQVFSALERAGYEVPKIIGNEYKEGMEVIATFIPSNNEKSDTGKNVITRIIKPQINFKGKAIQIAQIEVTIDYDAKYDAELAALENTEEKTPDTKTVEETSIISETETSESKTTAKREEASRKRKELREARGRARSSRTRLINKIKSLEKKLSNLLNKKETTKKSRPKTARQVKVDFLSENNGKEVTINGITGTLSKINDNRYEVITGNRIYELLLEDITSFEAIEPPTPKYSVENISDDEVTVNGVDYTINTDNKGNIISLSPKNNPKQNIKNERLLLAVEIERNKSEYNAEVSTQDDARSDALKTNLPNLEKLLNNIWEFNMTDSISDALDKLYNGEKLSDSEELSTSLWLSDVFDRISKLIDPKNTEEENAVILEAYNTAEIINSLLYDLNNLTLNKDGKQQKGKNTEEVKANVTSKKSKGEIRQDNRRRQEETEGETGLTNEKEIQDLEAQIAKLKEELEELEKFLQSLDSQVESVEEEIKESTPTEISYKDVSPTLKEQWILENGEVDKTYSLPDGTRIKVIRRTDNTVTLERGGHQIEVQVGDNKDVVDFVQMRDQVASEKISDAELYEILKSEENSLPLSLRQKIIKIFHAGRLAGLSGKIKASNKLIGRTLSDFISQSTIDMLNILLPSMTGGLIIDLVEAYRQGVVNKNAPQSMEELLERAEISQEDRQVLRDMMTYEEFASFFAYISQADTIYSFQAMNGVRYGMQSEVETLKRQLEFIEAMDFEATPEERLNNRLEQVVNEIVKIFGRQSLFIEGIGMTPDGFITMEDKPTNVEVLTILIDMFEKSYGKAYPKDIAKNFIEANDKLAEYGIKIHLDSMFTHQLNYLRKGIGRDVILNAPKENEDSKAFLEEFDDLVMSEKAVEAINKDRPFLVKDEKGMTVEFFPEDLPNIDSERVVSTTNLINEELKRYDMKISREYVAAYLSVNEDIFALHDRIVNRIVDIEEVLNYNTGDIRTNMSPVTTEYFDKTKAARQAEENTCS